MWLKPILVSGGGRSGSTGLMELLASSHEVALDRTYPFENRYLTYLVKWAHLQERPGFYGRYNPSQLVDFSNHDFAGYPWLNRPPCQTNSENRTLVPSPEEWIRGCWGIMTRTARRTNSAARCYAEKVPVWMPSLVRACFPCHTLYLFRDPRDVYLSVRSFNQKRGYSAFGWEPGQTDFDYAQRLAYAHILAFENYRADQGRDDCTLIRYEDLVTDRSGTIARLDTALGLTLNGAEGFQHVALHQTAESVELSTERWRREDIPREVVRLFDHPALQESMGTLGYKPSSRDLLPAYPAIDFAHRPERKLAALECSPHGTLRPAGENGAEVTVTGDDFWIILPIEPIEASRVQQIWVSCTGTTGNTFSLYWRSREEGFSEDRCIHRQFDPSPEWRVVSFEVDRSEHWRGTIAQLRLDLFNGPVNPTANRGYVRWVKLV